MAVALAEPHDLVFDRWTIARAAARDLSGIHRRAMHVVANDRVRGLAVRVMPHSICGVFDPLGQRRERLGRLVARLHLQRRPVDRAAVEPRRRAGLQPAERKADIFQRARQSERRRFADAAGGNLFFADMDQAAQKRSGGEHHGAGANLPAVGKFDAAHASRRRSADRRPRLRSPRDWRGREFPPASPPHRACDRPARAARAPPGPCAG